ncbi:MAG: leucyl aminopeptidase [Candidatus Omnitrophica bacterium]|nr:leucyl aminopeptidase [Candidatus Omnitrophota bacterium]
METILMFSADKRTPADLFITGLFQNGRFVKELKLLDPVFAKDAESVVQKGRLIGKFEETLSFYHSGYQEAPEVLLLGLGDRKSYSAARFRQIIGVAVKAVKGRKINRVRILLDSFLDGKLRLQEAVPLLTETACLASYEFDKYKKKDKDEEKAGKKKTLEILVTKKQGRETLYKGIERARIIANATVFARNLINEPGNVINPQTLAAAARQLALSKKIHCKIFGLADLKKLKMNGILAVNQGSVTPPALIVLEYGNRFKGKGTICLVGKGVTFDTGGISIKPSKDMEVMKSDMSGAAAVISVLGVIADLRLPLHVVGLAPAVENMAAQNPQRPGDIIRMLNGKTVEVRNTDAEGRLILADALAYTERYRPKAIIDIATLTGSCAATFGDKAIGMLGTSERLMARVKRAGEETGERCWQLPLWEDYAKSIKGDHSDLSNIGGPYAGTITAAIFLKEFVPDNIPWVHLDIAGTAWCDKSRFDCVKGATGVGVRLLTRFLSDWK